MKSILVLLALSFSFAVHAESNLSELPKNDRLGKMARGINTNLSDGNITNCGVTHVEAYAVKDEVDDWSETMSSLVKENYGDDFDDVKTDEQVVKVTALKKTSVKTTVDALMMSNDYNPKAKDIRAQLNRTVWALLRQLEVGKETQVVTATASVRSECGEGFQKIQSILFVNPETQKAVHFFAAEGFM